MRSTRAGVQAGEEDMANKDKGGKQQKTTAAKTLKQKRSAKKDKKSQSTQHRTV
jgi:hypothetical protein